MNKKASGRLETNTWVTWALVGFMPLKVLIFKHAPEMYLHDVVVLAM